MRYYLFSAVLIVFAVLLITFIPIALKLSNKILISAQIPQNNSYVLGIQNSNVPPVGKNLAIPSFSAKAVLVKDLGTGTILFQNNANTPLPIASTTKIMSALVATEYFAQNSILTVNQGASIPGSRIGLVSGEDLSFRSALYGMLLPSGNDAAYTIAENYPGGVLGFVSAMNKKAQSLGLKNTRFDNPAGFDSPNHYSSASDLGKITEEALKNSNLARVFATKETDIVSLDKKHTYDLRNLNKLLSDVAGVLGVKTGTTEEAKESLVTLVERGGHKVLIILLGSDDRFGETTNLINWTYSNFIWPGS